MTAVTAPKSQTAAQTQNQNQHHTVRRGETLSQIAEQHSVRLDDVLRANPQIKDPAHIHAGQRVTLPGAPAQAAPPQEATASPPPEPRQPREYVVKPGDTMHHIARDHRLSLNELTAANPDIKNPSLIRPGQVLQLPGEAREPTGSSRSAAPNGGLDPRLALGDVSQVPSTLSRGASGEPVREVQGRLNELGYGAGQADGDFGPMTQGAVRSFQTANTLPTTGAVDAATRERLFSDEAKPAAAVATDAAGVPRLDRYPPFSNEAKQLFSAAARQAGVPESWASSSGLHNILQRESDGNVGIPNYTYGARKSDPSRWSEVHAELRAGRITARSSATGLGQLLLRNVDAYYPNGRAGIGDPVQEAAGMLSYIKDRYGSPEEAWRRYGTVHEGY